MDKALFKELYEKRLKDPMTNNQREMIIYASVLRVPPSMKKVVCMEELAELIQVISKHLRDEGDPDNMDILEEEADVYLILEFLHLLYGHSSKKIMAALDAKLEREAGRCGDFDGVSLEGLKSLYRKRFGITEDEDEHST